MVVETVEIVEVVETRDPRRSVVDRLRLNARPMQFSLFGAAVAEPALDDLAGVVLAGGDWVRADEDCRRARLSVVVDAPWRVEALLAAFAELELGARPRLRPRTGRACAPTFSAELAPRPRRLDARGRRCAPPAGLALTARGLRLWAIAAGRADAAGYLLGTADPTTPIHRAAGAQLAAARVWPATSITVRARPGWRVTSAKRLRRLAELLGEPPAGAAPTGRLACCARERGRAGAGHNAGR